MMMSISRSGHDRGPISVRKGDGIILTPGRIRIPLEHSPINESRRLCALTTETSHQSLTKQTRESRVSRGLVQYRLSGVRLLCHHGHSGIWSHCRQCAHLLLSEAISPYAPPRFDVGATPPLLGQPCRSSTLHPARHFLGLADA